MQIGILGTGSVGQTIGTALTQKGHKVMLGSRTIGNEKAMEWLKKNDQNAFTGSFEEAAKFGEVIFICINGAVTAEVLKATGTTNFVGKTVIDVTNPLDFRTECRPRFYRNIVIHGRWAKKYNRYFRKHLL